MAKKTIEEVTEDDYEKFLQGPLSRGKCPQCGLQGKESTLFYNSKGYVECPHCRLCVIRGANGNEYAYILKKRGTGDYQKNAVLSHPERWATKEVLMDLGDIYAEVLKEMKKRITQMHKQGEINDDEKAEYLEQSKHIVRREEIEIKYLLSEGETHDKADAEVRWLKQHGASHLSSTPVMEIYNKAKETADFGKFLICSDEELRQYLDEKVEKA